MNRIAVLFVLILLFAGAGGGAWWFLLREQPELSAEAQLAAAMAEEEVGLIEATRYIEIKPLVMPIIREGRVILHLTLIMAVELVHPLEKKEVEQLVRPLRDAILTELHSLFALRYVQERGYDLPFVKERIYRVSERVIGKGLIKAVLIQRMNRRKPQQG
ncbi:MAG: hypothetical protein V3T80_00220 [Kiloniellales bacterium]|jgi:hypothetical protein